MNNVKLDNHSVVNETTLIVTANSTSHCSLSLYLLPDLNDTIKKHLEMTKIAKVKGIKLVRRYRTLTIMKEIAKEAVFEYVQYKKAFNDLFEFWNQKVHDNILSYKEKSELDIAYEKRNNIYRMFNGNQKLSIYIEKANRINEMLETVKSAKAESNGLTLYY